MECPIAKHDICILSFRSQVKVKSGHCVEEHTLQWENYFCV
jgi:hypothetical protein